MDWSTGYLRQAQADYDQFRRMSNDYATASFVVQADGSSEVPLCHRLHYLQMTTEKLAKGFLLGAGIGDYAHTHNAFVKFLRVARSKADIRGELGRNLKKPYSTRAYFEYVNALSSLTQQIENLSPEGEEHPNPEYPWKGATEQIISPLDYSFP